MSYAEIQYDSNGYPLLKSDFNGNSTAFTYNAKGQLIQTIEGYGTGVARKTVYAWDTGRNRLTSVTIGGVTAGTELLRTAYTYTGSNRLNSVVQTNLSTNGIANQARTTTFAYTTHPNGMLASVTVNGPISGASDAVTTSYNASGDVVSIKNSLGHQTTYGGHNLLGQPGRRTGANGDITDYFYDPRGRLVTVRTYPNGIAADTVYAYAANGLLESTRSPDGTVEQLVYNPQHRLDKRYIDSSGVLAGGGIREESRYGYNLASDVTAEERYATEGHYEIQLRFTCLQPKGAPANQCAEPEYKEEQVWVVSPVLKQSAYTDYDELSRPRANRGNNGQNVSYTYDDNGNIETVKDSQGKVTTLTYDALDRVVKALDPLSGLTKFEYNAIGNLTKVTDPRDKAATYVYDGFGQLWAQHSPDTGTTTFEHNSAGQRTKMTRANGVATNYGYDGLGRLVSVTASGQSLTYSYDGCTNGKGRLCSTTSPNANTAFQYELDGRLRTRVELTTGNGYQSDYWTYYYYDDLGRMNALVYPNGVAVGYGYAYGRLRTMTVNIGGTIRNVITDAGYLPFGPVMKWTYGNGLQRLMERDKDGRLTAIHTDYYQGLYYGFDTNASLVNGRDRTYDQSFGYDALNRLTTVRATNADENLWYDANGNRTRYQWWTPGNYLADVSYLNDSSNNRVLDDHITYGYDALGNRLSQSWGGVDRHLQL